MHPDIGYIPGELNVVSDFLSRYNGMGVSKENLTDASGVGIVAVEITHDYISPTKTRCTLPNDLGLPKATAVTGTRSFLQTSEHKG